MREVNDLSFEELREIVNGLQALTFLDIDSVGDFWNPDKNLDADHLGAIANLLARYDLRPDEMLDHLGQPLTLERRAELE